MKPFQLILAVLAFLLVGVCSAQPAERWVRVEYTKQIKESVLARMSLTPELKKMMQTTPAVLIAGTHCSLYEETGPSEGRDDKPANAPVQIPLKEEVTKRIDGGLFVTKVLQKIYKSRLDNQVVTIRKSSANTYRTEGELKHYAWTITNEVSTIAEMTCRKASAPLAPGLTIEAWFTDEIPLSDGPANANGLPGLILKIETAQFTVEANKISFIEKQVIEKPTEGQLVNKEELLQRTQEDALKGRENMIKNEVINQLNNPKKN